MNKKHLRTAVWLISAVMLMTAAGCGGQDTGSAADAPSVQQTLPDKEKKDSSSGKNEQYLQIYDGILQSAAALLTDCDNRDPAEGESGIWEAAIGLEPYEALERVGYTLDDISGDGIPELIIGNIPDDEEVSGNEIFAVYTCVDGSPHLTAEGWYRNAYYYLGDGRFFNRGSAGAMCSIHGTYNISEDGSEMICEDYWFTYAPENDPNEIGLYWNTYALPDPDISEGLDITEDEFWQHSDSLLMQAQTVKLTPFSRYADGGEASREAAVSVQWADDIPEDAEDCMEFTADRSDDAVSVIFTPSAGVADFRLLRLTPESSEDGESVSFSAGTLCSLEELTPQCPLIADIAFYGDLPSYGISYEDEDGRTRRYAVEISGEDGSLILSEF